MLSKTFTFHLWEFVHLSSLVFVFLLLSPWTLECLNASLPCDSLREGARSLAGGSHALRVGLRVCSFVFSGFRGIEALRAKSLDVIIEFEFLIWQVNSQHGHEEHPTCKTNSHDFLIQVACKSVALLCWFPWDVVFETIDRAWRHLAHFMGASHSRILQHPFGPFAIVLQPRHIEYISVISGITLGFVASSFIQHTAYSHTSHIISYMFNHKPWEDKMLKVEKNNENRSLKTNRLFPTANKPDPMPQNLAFLFTKITPEQMIYMWNVLTAIFVTQVLMVIGYCAALATFPQYWWTCTLLFGIPFSYIAIQQMLVLCCFFSRNILEHGFGCLVVFNQLLVFSLTTFFIRHHFPIVRLIRCTSKLYSRIDTFFLSMSKRSWTPEKILKWS